MANNATTLSREQAETAFDYDPSTGIFIRKYNPAYNAHWNAKYAGKPTGMIARNGYVMVRHDRVKYLAHRVAWLLTYGEWPKGQIDHINRDRTDNRIENLRLATPAQQMANRPTWNRLGVRGVARAGSRFHASLTVNGRSKHLGSFANIRDAIDAVNAKGVELHGSFWPVQSYPPQDGADMPHVTSRRNQPPRRAYPSAPQNHSKHLRQRSA